MAQGGVRCRGSGEGQKARRREEPSRAGSPAGGELMEGAVSTHRAVLSALLAFAARPDAVC